MKSSKFKIAVILFPGTNCENETKYVLEKVGFTADIIRWNMDPKIIESYDGYLLPGGWSYEDRIRAGVIAAKGNIIKILTEQDKKGKPILGICNGCQILVESGLVPNLEIEKVEFALAPNHNPKVSGFYCTWVTVKKKADCAFTKTVSNDPINMPIAHAEGRFVTTNKDVLEQLNQNGQIVFTYTDSSGKEIKDFPVNPNGSVQNIAGIANKRGNVLAMMPHPERASFGKQLKTCMDSFEDGEAFAPAVKIFESMKKYLEGN